MRMSYFSPMRGDVAQDVRQLGPRHDAVLRAVARRQPADGAERLLAALPQQQPFRVGVGPAHFAGLVLLGDGDDALGVGVEARFQAVHFHDEHRAGVEREAEVERRLDRLQDRAGRASPSAAGTMPAPMMSLMVLVASSTVSKTPSSVRYASGLRVMRTQILVAMPKVPSEPTMTPVRS